MSENFMDKIISENFDTYLETLDDIRMEIEVDCGGDIVLETYIIYEFGTIIQYKTKKKKDFGVYFRTKNDGRAGGTINHGISAKIILGDSTNSYKGIPIKIPTKEGEEPEFPSNISEKQKQEVMKYCGKEIMDIAKTVADSANEAWKVPNTKSGSDKFVELMNKIVKDTSEYSPKIVKQTVLNSGKEN